MTRPAVTFVAPAGYPLGGVATWLDHIVPDLRTQGFDTAVLLAAGRHHDAAAYRRAHPAIEPATEVRAASSTREGRVRALAAAIPARVDPARPHVVVSVNIPDAVLAVTRLRARQRAPGLRAVLSVHGLEPDLYADLAALAPLLDGAICSNRLAAARAARVPGLAPQRVHYAAYGTALVDMPARDPGAPFTIGFAGRFERFQKRIQDLDPIAGALDDAGVAAHWLLAGDGPQRARVERVADGRPGRVEVPGAVAPDRMGEDFFRRCDVLLNPSAWETGPIVVWEAMARGVAVVSTRYTGSGREAALVDGANCLLFDVGDTAAAAACLARAADPTLRARLATAARDLVRTRYSPQASCSAWAAAIAAIAAATPRAAPEPPMPAAGRLDRWLGAGVAARLRALRPARYAARAPGDEWPHTHCPVRRDAPAHWADLQALDAESPR